MGPTSLAPRCLRGGSGPPAVCYEQGKGHVSVNPVYGCNIGCPFCVSQADPWRPVGDGQTTLAPVQAILEGLVQHAAWLRRLRLSVMDFCDPFDPAVRPQLRQLMQGLDANLPGQVVLLTTRLHPGEQLLRWLASLHNIKLSLFVSLGDAAGGVQPVTPVKARLRLLEQSSRQGLHTVMLLRPLVAEWTRRCSLRRLLEHAARSCHEVVLAGLNLTPPVQASLLTAGWPVPAEPADRHGGVERQLRERVLQLSRQVVGQLPLSEHRSCAINRHRELGCTVAAGCAAGPLEIRACRGYCSMAAPRTEAAPLPLRACEWCLGQGPETDHRPRDAAGYCLLKAA